jgi:hypothetical protein
MRRQIYQHKIKSYVRSSIHRRRRARKRESEQADRTWTSTTKKRARTKKSERIARYEQRKVPRGKLFKYSSRPKTKNQKHTRVFPPYPNPIITIQPLVDGAVIEEQLSGTEFLPPAHFLAWAAARAGIFGPSPCYCSRSLMCNEWSVRPRLVPSCP